MKSTLQKAVDLYGKESQVFMAIEEMAELMKELSKERRGEDNKMEISEEIADVKIMLEQLILIFDCALEVDYYKIQKLERLEQRIRNAEQEV